MDVPGPAPVLVVWARPQRTAELTALLQPSERGALHRLHRPEDQQRYVAAHALLRLVLATRWQQSAATITLAARCPVCGSGSHGKPYVRDSAVRVSLAHAGDRVVVAICDDAALGIDVELASAAGFDGFDAVALAPGEQRPATDHDRAVLWTRKEAVLKATGHGLAVEPAALRVSAADSPGELLAWPGGPIGPADVRLYGVPLGEDHPATLAVLDPAPRTVEIVDGSALLSEPAAAADWPRRSRR